MVRAPQFRTAGIAQSLSLGGLEIMPFEVKSCSIDEMRIHPTFADRTQAKVKVLLREIRSRETFDHNLTLRVWANTTDKMSPAEVKTALLTRAAAILKRTVSVAEIEVSGEGRVSKPTVSG
ncbi:MAG: hypothetical protein JWQ89_4195 [Devosia sp.]|uniref:hypothetical protein n=1 Tax=Devosia sp. TaxID=1871048 RepID=UPI0026239FA4|nr:hypothetical protein [Devosia sp.]MDB5542468.1 hypothetical protein [Devosia sp.]